MSVRRSVTILALAAIFAGSSSVVVARNASPPAPVFSAAKMAAAIEAAMKPRVVAFSYTIAKDGKVVLEKGFGPARIAIDGYRAHGPMQRNNIASVTKTFTAVAVMQLIEANKGNGVSIYTKIGAYLPDGWKAGPNVAGLSFAELMRHTSGFNSGGGTGFPTLGYEAIKAMVAAGTTPPPGGGAERVRAYDNANYALLRELMPKLWAASGAIKLETSYDKNLLYKTPGDYSSYLYLLYLNTKMFQPIGIDAIGCSDQGPTATLYYTLNPDPKVSGVPGPQQTKYCGSGGMNISTNEMTRFLVYLFNTDKLLPPTARQLMMDKRLGLDFNSTTRGAAYSRTGIVGIGANSQGNTGVKACMMHYPDGVDAALVQNSPDNASLYPCSVLVAAFDAGWK